MDGCGKMEDGGWRMEDGGWKYVNFRKFSPLALKGNFPEHHPKKISDNQRYLRVFA